MGDPANTPHRSDTPKPVAPYPPRYWWLKRGTAAVLVTLLALSAAWLWWRAEARGRLRAELDALAARGQVASVGELESSKLPDDRNAAVEYVRAFGAVKPGVDSPASSQFTFPDPPYNAQWRQLADACVAAHGRMYEHVRAARAREKSDWGVPREQADFMPMLGHLNRSRHLANLVSDTAERQHFHGDDAGALELVRDVLHLAQSVDQQPLNISHLVSVGIRSIALSRLNVIAPAMNVADGAEGPGASSQPARDLLPATRPSAVPRPATRAQVRALIAELLDETAQVEQLRRAFVGDRAYTLESARALTETARLTGPMFDLDIARIAAYDPLLPQAATQPSWPAVQAVLAKQPPAPPRAAPPPAPAGTRVRRVAVDFPHALSDASNFPMSWRSIQQDMRVRMERRMAAVSLAARLYRADHGGAWPANLAQLVPTYLPAVPQDPFAPDGGPLRYLILPPTAPGGRPDGEGRPLVYSVGENGTDELAARPGLVGPRPEYSWAGFGAPDQWRDLSRWAPSTPATQPGDGTGAGGAPPGTSAEAADDQLDESDDPR